MRSVGPLWTPLAASSRLSLADRFTTSGPPRKLYRVARTADATAFAPWKYANADHVFSGRWDDPQGTFRSLYSGDSAEGAYIESLQDFRRSTQLIAALQKIEQNDPDFERMDPPAPGTGSGIVPAAWFEGRFLGEFTVDGGRYVDILAVESIELVRIRLAQRSLELGLSNVSAGTLLGEQRAFTQALARAVYDDPGGYAGIHAPSSLGLPGSNYALFESGPSSEIARAPAQLLYVAPVGPEDPALQRAVKSLGLELERIELDRLRLSGSRGLAIVSESDVAQAARHELQNGGISDEHIRQLPAPSGTADVDPVPWIVFGLDFKLPLVLGARS